MDLIILNSSNRERLKFVYFLTNCNVNNVLMYKRNNESEKYSNVKDIIDHQSQLIHFFGNC